MMHVAIATVRETVVAVLMKLAGKFQQWCWIMLLHFPGGSTLQRGTGRVLMCPRCHLFIVTFLSYKFFLL